MSVNHRFPPNDSNNIVFQQKKDEYKIALKKWSHR